VEGDRSVEAGVEAADSAGVTTSLRSSDAVALRNS
jgi:hypothetical protein